MYGATAPPRKTEARLASTDKPGSPPRRTKPRQVIYKSTALTRAAPALVASATPAAIAASKGIREASAEAERVRDEFKLAKCGPEIDVGEGDDEATNAKKYERRLLMNRHSAAASRVRREAYTKALEAQVVQQEALVAAIQKAWREDQERNRKKEGSDVESDGGVEVEEVEDEGLQIEGLEGFPSVAEFATMAPKMPVMESQTEEFGEGENGVAKVEDVLTNGAQAEADDVVGPHTKLEDILGVGVNDTGIPVPVDMVPMVSNERLLESFLFEEPAQNAEFGNLDLL